MKPSGQPVAHPLLLGAVSTLALLGGPLLAGDTRPSTVADIVARLQAARNATDFRATGRLVRIEGGQRKNYQISMRGRATPGVLRMFCEVTDPSPSRIRLLLESPATGRAQIRTGHAGDRAPSDLPFERWNERLLDTDFAYEDLFESQFTWRNQTLLEETKYGARACFVVRSEPGAADRTHYSAVTTWLDREIYYPVKVEKTAKGSGVVKEFIYYGLRQSRGVWSASQIECKTKGRPGSTLLIISRGSELTKFEPSAFDPALLIKP
jgi:Outer membrane lipoprotein-sorting protein